MRPILCVMPIGGGVTLWSFGLLVWTGIALASLLYWFRYGHDARAVPSLIVGCAAVGCGFLLSHWLRVFCRHGARAFLTLDMGVWIPSGGFSVMPALFIGGVLLVLAFRALNIPVLQTMDRLAPYLALAHAVTRIGCFMAGCCYGRPSPEGWGVVFPPGSHAALHYGGVPVWPVQLMEAACLFALYLLLSLLPERHRLIGYCAGYGAARFVLEFFRGDIRGRVGVLGLSQPQAFALLMVIAALALLASRHAQGLRESTSR